MCGTRGQHMRREYGEERRSHGGLGQTAIQPRFGKTGGRNRSCQHCPKIASSCRICAGPRMCQNADIAIIEREQSASHVEPKRSIFRHVVISTSFIVISAQTRPRQTWVGSCRSIGDQHTSNFHHALIPVRGQANVGHGKPARGTREPPDTATSRPSRRHSARCSTPMSVRRRRCGWWARAHIRQRRP